MNPENRNMILAITLSMAVLFGWQMFVVGPELEKEAAMQQAIAEQEAAAAAASGDAPQVDPDAVAGSAGAAATGQLSASDAAPAVEAPRIVIDAPLVSGSISLAGLRVDDIMLKAYQETQDPDSENIQFLLKLSLIHI